MRFERGEPRRFDLVVGADGIHSRVRRCAFGPERDFVRYLGYYYAVAGVPGLGGSGRAAATAHMYCGPGRSHPRRRQGGHLYVFASPALEYARDDIDRQRAIVRDAFAGMGWQTQHVLAQLDTLDGFYLDAIARTTATATTSAGSCCSATPAYGNTLGGFGTGLAIVGAYVLAGELAVADGDHEAAYARYDEIMRRYAKIAGNSNAGRFMAPRTAWGIRGRNWLLGSRAFGLMMKYGDKAANDIDLADYPALAGIQPEQD